MGFLEAVSGRQAYFWRLPRCVFPGEGAAFRFGFFVICALFSEGCLFLVVPYICTHLHTAPSPPQMMYFLLARGATCCSRAAPGSTGFPARGHTWGRVSEKTTKEQKQQKQGGATKTEQKGFFLKKKERKRKKGKKQKRMKGL